MMHKINDPVCMKGKYGTSKKILNKDDTSVRQKYILRFVILLYHRENATNHTSTGVKLKDYLHVHLRKGVKGCWVPWETSFLCLKYENKNSSYLNIGKNKFLIALTSLEIFREPLMHNM